ncbi:carboxypeptidase regulatory-like domain-containing protein [Paraflavitalea pollutisoli]|uniref:carboxypeptidase regulatory-like domain-containing protein n=1 Tax=Paraflavitalea pollutisoli TaxID=3034143 RepID=UPI0023ED70A4|nr:carboxypeptidase regulatory-like domain-containing protein [Paraflavitalea sp. H1-2-19X]
MKPLTLTCFLLALSILTYSQSGKITGSVMDSTSKTPLELATITILGPDSSVIAYKLSDKEGQFSFEKLPLRKKLLVNITYTGYGLFHTTIQQDSARTDTLNVLLSLNSSDAVIVTAAIPIKMNGDTLEINPAAFKMKGDAVVEEMLNQVSGIVVWADGSITVNGKQVSNLLVDGKPFMGSTDTRVATQNLPKAAIEKIQLYQEFDRSKIGQPGQAQGQPQDSLLTMNLKLKESAKKGYFGKAGVGYGTRDRFEGDFSMQMYNKTSSVGIGGGINNINKSIGNLQEMFQNNTYRNSNPNLNNVGRFGTNGINKNHSFGGVLVHNFIESSNSRQNDRITLNYNKSGVNAFVTDNSFQTRTTVEKPQFIHDEGQSNNRSDNHDVGLQYVKTNSYNDNFSINGSFNTRNGSSNSQRFTEVRDSANQLQSTNRVSSSGSNRSDNQSVRMSFAKSNNDAPAQNFNARVNASRDQSSSERNTISDFRSMTAAGNNTFLDRLYNNQSERIAFNAELSYAGFKRLLMGRHNLFGFNLSLDQSFNYDRNTDEAAVSDYDTTIKKRNINEKLSNYNRRELIEYTPSLSLMKWFSKNTETGYRSITMSFSLMNDFKIDKNSSSITQRNLDRNFSFLRYSGWLGYNKSEWQKYQGNASLFISKTYGYPSIDRLYTIVDDIDAYNIQVGNPFLRNNVNHSIGLNSNFSTQNRKSPYSFNAGLSGNYNTSKNPVTDSTINDTSGKRITYFVNADHSRNANLSYNFNISRKFGTNTLQLMYNGNFNFREQPNYIDGISNTSTTNTLSNTFKLFFMLGSKYVFSAEQVLQRNKSKPTAPGLNAFTNNNGVSRLGITVNATNNLTFSSTAERVTNSNLDKPFILWNSFATYRFMQQQGELKFSAMDLLKKYQNITNSVYSYGTTTRISNGLQQYFLLTFSYYPRKFGKTEIRRKEGPKNDWD